MKYTSDIHSTTNYGHQLTPQGPPVKEGSSTPASDAGERVTVDFSILDLDKYLALDGLHEPMQDYPLSSDDPATSEQFWSTHDPCMPDNADIPSKGSTPSSGKGASSCPKPQNIQPALRGFGLDISNGKNRPSQDVPPPESNSSSGVTTAKVETPANSSYIDEKHNESTSSSSPARKSAKQRRKANPSSSRERRNATPSTSRTTRSAAPSTSRKPRRVSPSSGAKTTKKSEKKGAKVPCDHPGVQCEETFCDVSAKDRHIIEVHLQLRPVCPGCGKSFSRECSLTRHIGQSKQGVNCRAKAQEVGWREVERRGKIGLSKGTRTDRRKLIATHTKA